MTQRRSEGLVEEQFRDDDESEEDETIEPLVMEGLPEELGSEWTILHPFDIPGVRNPTEDTPPNHRRLAENDTLVELIQTAEYLKMLPHGNREDFTHRNMEILSTEDVVEVVVEVEEEGEVGYKGM